MLSPVLLDVVEPWAQDYWYYLYLSDSFKAHIAGLMAEKVERLKKQARKEMPQRNRAQKNEFEAYVKRLGKEWWETVTEMGLMNHPGYAKKRDASGNVVPGQGVCDHELCPTGRCYQKFGRTEIMSKPKTEEQAKLERQTVLVNMLFLVDQRITKKRTVMSKAQFKAIQFLVKAEGSAMVAVDNGPKMRCTHIEVVQNHG